MQKNNKDSKIVIIPVSYDLTTSYMPGTAAGPKAIIDASRYIEAYDEETGKEIYKMGIHTLKDSGSKTARPEVVIKNVEAKALKALSSGKLPVIVGGEHSITLGAVKAFKKAVKDFSVLQLDAHMDMRDSFQGSRYSHACIAKRITEITGLTQVGIRSLSKEEAKMRPRNLNTIFMKDMVDNDKWIDKAIGLIKAKKVYVTIDMDAFDPSVMPSVGTPEPGGMRWYDALKLFRKLVRKKEVIGFDVVELAPIKGYISPDFFAARLIYKFLNYIFWDKER